MGVGGTLVVYSVILTSKRGGSFGCGWNPCCLQLDMNLNPWSGVKKKKPVLKIETKNPAQHNVYFVFEIAIRPKFPHVTIKVTDKHDDFTI